MKFVAPLLFAVACATTDENEEKYALNLFGLNEADI